MEKFPSIEAKRRIKSEIKKLRAKTFPAATDSSRRTAWTWAPASSRDGTGAWRSRAALLDFPERNLPHDLSVKAHEELGPAGEALAVSIAVHLIDPFVKTMSRHEVEKL
jgi:hypothetical protein